MLKIKFLKEKGLGKILAILTVLPFLAYAAYWLRFRELIFPGVHAAGVYISYKSSPAVAKLLAEKVSVPEKLVLVSGNQNFEIETKELNLVYNFSQTAEAAYSLDRTGNIFYDIASQVKAPFRNKNLGLRFELDEEKLNSFLSVVDGQVSEEAIPPAIKLIKGEIVVDKGRAGKEADLEKLKIEIGQTLAFANFSPIEIPFVLKDPSLTDTEAKTFKERGEKFLGKSLDFTFEYQAVAYKTGEILPLLSPGDGFNEAEVEKLVNSLANLVNREPQNPAFEFADGRVREFAPAKDGVKAKEDELNSKILESLAKLENEEIKEISLEIPVTRTAPKVKTEEVNDLGIKELVGRGTSRFRGSIPSRVYNITLAASRINGVLIKPGEVFSFNDALGDVSKFTGYQEAYIIKDGKTILGDGGGVCQVSSTLFRAALNAGLPIIERRAHAYRVGYYEQDALPGFDATVYSPTTDLKIKNDTGGHILIQASANTKAATLVFELYGTSDGRVAKTTRPAITDVILPPEDLYQEDPTLPAGQIKQIDYKASGAKVVFTYTVERAGEIIYQKKFISNYRPWQAVFLRGAGPTQ